jgi:hypothetical protein
MNIVTPHAGSCGIDHHIHRNLFKTAGALENSHQEFQVQLGDRFTPVTEEFKEMARGMDDNNNGIIESGEILPDGTTRLGHVQVDQPDYTFSFKHHLAGWANPYADSYPSAAKIADKLDGFVAEYPGLVHKVSLGQTAEGRDLWAVRVGKGPEGEKPGVLVVGGHHAREWAGNGAVTTAIETLLEGYGKDPEMTEKVDNMELWFVPMANPDGYEFSRNADPDWRKNRSRHPEVNGVGTDLNRNYRADYRFHGDAPKRTDDDQGASDNPNALTFRGPHAVSEKESQTITNFVDTRPNLKGVLDVHGFGRMILFPGTPDKAREATYRQVADRINEALDIKYTPLAIPELYPTTGDLSAYAEKKGVLSMGLEIGTSFQPAPEKIKDITNRGSKAVIAFIDQVAEQSLQPNLLA